MSKRKDNHGDRNRNRWDNMRKDNHGDRNRNL